MAIVPEVPAGKSLAARLLTTDFCPGANRFVYWLKEPVGWFVLAIAFSVLIGLYVAPIGWTLAASLSAVIGVGMAWPAIAVRAVTCSLRPDQPHVHEEQACELHLAVRNRLPLPVWGLAVEGFLDRRSAGLDQRQVPTVALAFVRAWATSTYRFSVRPELRGRYPDGDAQLTCSFPFGIWTARQKLRAVSPVTVWPKVFPIAGQTAMSGRQAADHGEGHRSGRTGDFVGLREFRRGDCLRQVNWTATARSGDLIVTERSGPQCPSVEVIVDASRAAHRDPLADRIRVAASLLANLQSSGVPLRLCVAGACMPVRRGWEGYVQMMDALAAVPLDGWEDQPPPSPARAGVSISIASNPQGDVLVCAADPAANRRSGDRHWHRVIRREQALAPQLWSLWSEVRDANLVA